MEMLMRPFTEHVEWTFAATSAISERKTKEYTASFTRPPLSNTGFIPQRFVGDHLGG